MLALPRYAPFAVAFWLIHVAFRFIEGSPPSLWDAVLPLLLFLPWMLRWRVRRVIVSVCTYFVVYYVAFMPLLDLIAERASWNLIPEIESVFFGGQNIVAAIQKYRTIPLNAFFCLGYSLHIFNIAVPLLYLMLIRKTSHAEEYAWAFLACGYLGFSIYLLFPVVPPRLALDGVTAVHPPWASATWRTAGEWFRANQFAAMPSLHCAFPFLSYLYLRARNYRLQWLFAGMSLWLFAGTIYLGEHYLSDVIGGVIVAYGAYRATVRGEKT
jgi:membrane-associated phospholipid phosphatase